MSWPTNSARRGGMARLLLAHVEDEFLLARRLRQEVVAGLAAERLEVLHGAGIGGDHAQHLARRHFVQRLARAQDGQRAVHAASVELLVVADVAHGCLRAVGGWVFILGMSDMTRAVVKPS